VNHEDWRVIEEFGTEGKSIVCRHFGGFTVEKAPKIVFV